MRDVLQLVLLFSLPGLVAGCQIPLVPAPPPGRTYYIAPEGGCIQGEYTSRRGRRGYYTALTELRKNGKAVANQSGTDNRRELLALTRDDPQAHALARSALRWQRFDSLMFLLPMTGVVLVMSGVWAASIGSETIRPGGAVLLGSGAAAFLSSLPLTIAMPWYRSERFEQAIRQYNADAQSGGCPDPPIDLPASTRTPGEGGRITAPRAADPMVIIPTERVDPVQSTWRVLELAKESQEAATRSKTTPK